MQPHHVLIAAACLSIPSTALYLHRRRQERARDAQEWTRALADLRARLERETAARHASEERLALLAQAMTHSAWSVDAEGRRTFLNPHGAERTGQPARPEAPEEWLDAVHPDDRAQSLAAWHLAVQTGQPYQVEYRLRRATDASWRWQLVRALPQRDADGRILAWYGTTTDIDDRKRAEAGHAPREPRVDEPAADLRKINDELAAANQELEAFSYSVSHDLRAPLRHIHGYVEMLRDRLGDALDGTSRRYLDTVSNSARHLGNLVDDLLAFARMGRQELVRREVCTRALVEEVRHALGPELTGRTIHWHIGELPQVVGDEAMLRQVWWNLLANAVKYTRPRAEAEIRVTTVPRDDGQVGFEVQDNGVGFDMRYEAKLFGVFQRLHRSDEFEGTGIGLAHVRRIVQRHGGQTWARGVLDEGATFGFSLPQ